MHKIRFLVKVYGWVWWCSVNQSCPTLCDPMDCSMPGLLSLTISWSLPKFMSIASDMWVGMCL